MLWAKKSLGPHDHGTGLVRPEVEVKAGAPVMSSTLSVSLRREWFEAYTAKDCLCCLQGYTVFRGFAVVTTTSKKSRAQSAYIHHGTKTKNWCELGDYVNEDTEVGKARCRGVLAG